MSAWTLSICLVALVVQLVASECSFSKHTTFRKDIHKMPKSVSLTHEQLLALKDYTLRSDSYSAFGRGQGDKPVYWDVLNSIFEESALSSVSPGMTLYRGVDGVNLLLDRGAKNPTSNVMSTSLRLKVALAFAGGHGSPCCVYELRPEPGSKFRYLSLEGFTSVLDECEILLPPQTKIKDLALSRLYPGRQNGVGTPRTIVYRGTLENSDPRFQGSPTQLQPSCFLTVMANLNTMGLDVDLAWESLEAALRERFAKKNYEPINVYLNSSLIDPCDQLVLWQEPVFLAREPSSCFKQELVTLGGSDSVTLVSPNQALLFLGLQAWADEARRSNTTPDPPLILFEDDNGDDFNPLESLRGEVPSTTRRIRQALDRLTRLYPRQVGRPTREVVGSWRLPNEEEIQREYDYEVPKRQQSKELGAITRGRMSELVAAGTVRYVNADQWGEIGGTTTLTNVEDLRQLIGTYNTASERLQRWPALVDAVKAGQEMEMPMVLKTRDDKYAILSGNTRGNLTFIVHSNWMTKIPTIPVLVLNLEDADYYKEIIELPLVTGPLHIKTWNILWKVWEWANTTRRLRHLARGIRKTLRYNDGKYSTPPLSSTFLCLQEVPVRNMVHLGRFKAVFENKEKLPSGGMLIYPKPREGGPSSGGVAIVYPPGYEKAHEFGSNTWHYRGRKLRMLDRPLLWGCFAPAGAGEPRYISVVNMHAPNFFFGDAEEAPKLFPEWATMSDQEKADAICEMVEESVRALVENAFDHLSAEHVANGEEEDYFDTVVSPTILLAPFFVCGDMNLYDSPSAVDLDFGKVFVLEEQDQVSFPVDRSPTCCYEESLVQGATQDPTTDLRKVWKGWGLMHPSPSSYISGQVPDKDQFETKGWIVGTGASDHNLVALRIRPKNLGSPVGEKRRERPDGEPPAAGAGAPGGPGPAAAAAAAAIAAVSAAGTGADVDDFDVVADEADVVDEGVDISFGAAKRQREDSAPEAPEAAEVASAGMLGLGGPQTAASMSIVPFDFSQLGAGLGNMFGAAAAGGKP